VGVVTYWSDLFAERVLPTGAVKPRIHAAGAFCIGLMHARLLPEDALRLSHVSKAQWDGLLSATGVKAVKQDLHDHQVSLHAVADALGCSSQSLQDDFLSALTELAKAKMAVERIAQKAAFDAQNQENYMGAPNMWTNGHNIPQNPHLHQNLTPQSQNFVRV
jgi:hypothetical protein